MAVYFANKIEAPGTGNSTPSTLAWSRHAADRKGPAKGSPLVAVAFQSGHIGVYTGACHATCSSLSSFSVIILLSVSYTHLTLPTILLV